MEYVLSKTLQLEHLATIWTTGHLKFSHRFPCHESKLITRETKTNYNFFQYFHDGSDTLVDQLTLVARTRSKTSVPATLLIKIIPVNDETPKLVNNTELEVWAGSSALLTNQILGKLTIFKIPYYFGLDRRLKLRCHSRFQLWKRNCMQ